MFVPGKTFQSSLLFVGKARPRVEHLEGSLIGQAPALPAIIRLGCRGLPGTNTLAYYENL